MPPKDPPNTAPKRLESPKQESVKQGSVKQENVKQESPKQESPKQESPKQESPKQGTESNFDPHLRTKIKTILDDHTECPACSEKIEPPFAQCQSGHLICHQCRPLLTKCPLCRASIEPKIINFILNQVWLLVHPGAVITAPKSPPPSQPPSSGLAPTAANQDALAMVTERALENRQNWWRADEIIDAMELARHEMSDSAADDLSPGGTRYRPGSVARSTFGRWVRNVTRPLAWAPSISIPAGPIPNPTPRSPPPLPQYIGVAERQRRRNTARRSSEERRTRSSHRSPTRSGSGSASLAQHRSRSAATSVTSRP